MKNIPSYDVKTSECLEMTIIKIGKSSRRSFSLRHFVEFAYFCSFYASLPGLFYHSLNTQLLIGTITFLSLTGFLVFTLFFLAATVNAVIISLFVSLAAAGGFLAIFFTLALVVISTATITTTIAVLITTASHRSADKGSSI
ncbi:hypothetical protein MKW94_026940 [Papaver nudicaule]|uniref:Uncharacterized protein n=1 Tax=Papaver nudicaule TaxID=74823 RepID=A0AA42B207_PAPNU|nr:hypothetical protein [Papaver nudicaule]